MEAARQVHGLYTAQLLDADPDAPRPWLVTAYVAGPSLAQAVWVRWRCGCHSPEMNPWDFTAFTVAFANHTSPSPSPTPTPTPTSTSPSPTPTPSPSPTGSCAAAWVNNTAYVSGNVVSHGGHNWTANQWNYNEVPGGPAGAWNDDGPC